MTEREALIALNMIEGVGSILIKRLIQRFGAAKGALAASQGNLKTVEGIGSELSRRIAGWEKALDLEGELDKIKKLGISVITFNDSGYPEYLREIYDPPPVLYVKGALTEGDRHAIAVVGSRRCSHYGIMTAERLSAQIASRGLTVVSGLARGIDTASHRGALSAGGRTIAVLGSGIDRIYPPENRKVAERIIASGALLSEFPLGTPPNRQNFPLRNRVISGLSLGVVVVEAARRSGSLITVSQAMEQGRVVFAVPGRIDSYSSNGTHALIKDGAKLVESVDDICEEFPYLFPDYSSVSRASGRGDLPRPKLNHEEELVFNCVSSEETPVDEITRKSGLSPSRVSAALLGLELKRLVKQLPGKLFSRSQNA